MKYQKETLRGLIKQTPQADDSEGVWLSQIVRGIAQARYDGVPPSDMLNFPEALMELAKDGYVEPLEQVQRRYTQPGDSVDFLVDIRFRIVPSASPTP